MRLGGSNAATRPLRMVLGTTLVVAMLLAGALRRSPWILAVAAPGFTVLYVLGRWRPWLALWRGGGARKAVAGLAIALPIQAVLAGLFYLVGLGGGAAVAGPRPTAPLGASDIAVAGALFVGLTALAARIVAMEITEPMDLSLLETSASDDDLKIDPAPISVETLFDREGRSDAPRDALAAQGGARVSKTPFAASPAMIAAAEARLGVRLPEGLKRIYARRDGGYVGDLYAPTVARPGQSADDWRGAFAIDYSSLRALHQLSTVAAHYENFTHDEDEVPAHADRLVILEARYGDMTLLDYTGGDDDPAVLIVDFDKHGGSDPVDLRFPDFDAFLAALRRDVMWAPDPAQPFGELAEPLGDRDPAAWPGLFWDANPHVLYNVVASRKDGSTLAKKADDALIAATEQRLGVTIPPALAAIYRAKNGGGTLVGQLVTVREGRARQEKVFSSLAPLETWISLAALSARVDFPDGERPWADGVDGADRLIVIEAEDDEAVLLDYRGGGEPVLVTAAGLAAAQGLSFSPIGPVPAALARLRPRR